MKKTCLEEDLIDPTNSVITAAESGRRKTVLNNNNKTKTKAK